jgi:hypothetical protein
MGPFLGQGLKTGQGEGEWRKFFATAGAALSVIEKTARVALRKAYPNYFRDTHDFIRESSPSSPVPHRAGHLEVRRRSSAVKNGTLIAGLRSDHFRSPEIAISEQHSTPPHMSRFIYASGLCSNLRTPAHPNQDGKVGVDAAIGVSQYLSSRRRRSRVMSLFCVPSSIVPERPDATPTQRFGRYSSSRPSDADSKL